MIERTEARAKIADFLEQTFLFSFGDEVSETDNLFEKGFMDSYGLVQLVSFLENTFGLHVGDDMLASRELTYLGGITAYVERATSVGR
jgi:D-alanine--poly(phosphoribitol) ligase subunit 2